MSPVTQSYDELYPSRWLKASDIPEDGNLVLTVSDLALELIGQPPEKKLVASFREVEKCLPLNKTNAGTLKDLFGPDLNACIGKRISLFATPVTFASKVTMGIRISPSKPSGQKPVQQKAQESPQNWVE